MGQCPCRARAAASTTPPSPFLWSGHAPPLKGPMRLTAQDGQGQANELHAAAPLAGWSSPKASASFTSPLHLRQVLVRISAACHVLVCRSKGQVTCCNVGAGVSRVRQLRLRSESQLFCLAPHATDPATLSPTAVRPICVGAPSPPRHS
jgi:hypothetical protein